MITELGIANLGVISNARVELGPGLTVVSGETGAGKTMFVTALTILLGHKVDATIVRQGAQKAEIEGILDIPTTASDVVAAITEAGGFVEDTEAGAEAVISRTVAAVGRSRATAGGRTVPVAVLKDISAELVSLHGQSEQLTLKAPAKQRELLDAVGGAELQAVRASYSAAYARWQELIATASRLTTGQQDRAERIAFLNRGLEAIDAIRPQPGEDAELAATAARLGAAEELRRNVGEAHALLVGTDFVDATDATGLINDALARLQSAAALDESLTERLKALTDVSLQLADAAAELNDYLTGFDELAGVSLAETEDRRAALASLKAFGETIDDVLDFERRAGTELLELEAENATLDSIAADTAAAEAEVREFGGRLHALRAEAATQFTTRVSEELTALSMPRAQVSFALSEIEPQAHGMDAVTLQFSAHDASRPGDIAQVASGGELSRVMLAIEVVRAGTSDVPTYVFDEVDAGVGGRAAIEIGRRLARLASDAQVIVVTHLPQVAAWADTHVTVEKTDTASGAVSGVKRLDQEARVSELARMLAGVDDSRSARDHASELLTHAAEAKTTFRPNT